MYKLIVIIIIVFGTIRCTTKSDQSQQEQPSADEMLTTLDTVDILVFVKDDIMSNNVNKYVMLISQGDTSHFDSIHANFATLVDTAGMILNWIIEPYDTNSTKEFGLFRIKKKPGSPNQIMKNDSLDGGNGVRKLTGETKRNFPKSFVQDYVIGFKDKRGNSGGRTFWIDPKLKADPEDLLPRPGN